MKITSVSIRKVNNENRMRGIASVTLDDCFAVHGIRIIEGDKGLFTAMPSRKTNDGEYHDVAHPITQECRKMFEDAIMMPTTKKKRLNNQKTVSFSYSLLNMLFFSHLRSKFKVITFPSQSYKFIFI